jgi:hypothetical protein
VVAVTIICLVIIYLVKSFPIKPLVKQFVRVVVMEPFEAAIVKEEVSFVKLGNLIKLDYCTHCLY